MKMCARLEDDEFLDFYNTYSVAVNRFADCILKDEREALGVTDNTMWYAFCNPDKFRGRDRCAIQSYLMSIARTRSLDVIRRNSRTPCDENTDPDTIGYVAFFESAEGLVESAELTDLIGRCVRAMSEVYRETVLLRLFGGMTLPEISQRLHIPLDTAKSRWRRGRGILRDSIAFYFS